MTQHTPGPWTTSRDAVPSHHTQITVYAESSGERVATVFQTEANARLIAAAPELLEAASYALAWLNSKDSMSDLDTFHLRYKKAVKDLEAAIALATPGKDWTP